MEQALGTNPKDGKDAGAGLSAEVAQINGKDHLCLTHNQLKADVGLTYIVECSTDGGKTWHSGTPVIEVTKVVGLNENYNQVTSMMTVPIEEGTCLIRLRVITENED